MAELQRRYSKAEIARRGEAIYRRDIEPHLPADTAGQFAAIDIESGAYELGRDELATYDRLRSRVPDAQVWLVRVGFDFVHRFGGSAGPGAP